MYMWAKNFNFHSLNIWLVTLASIISLFIWAKSSPVQSVNIRQPIKVTLSLIRNQCICIWVVNFNVQTVNFRQLTNVPLLLIRNPCIWAKSSNGQTVNFRQVIKVHL